MNIKINPSYRHEFSAKIIDEWPRIWKMSATYQASLNDFRILQFQLFSTI